MVVMEEQKMSLPQRLWGIIIEPVKTFQAVCEDPRALIPMAVFLAINLVLTIWFLPQLKDIAGEAMKQTQTMTAEQIQTALKWTGILAVLASVAVPPLTWLIQAALLALFNQFSIGAAKFKQLFVVAFFAWIPAFLGGLIKSVYMAGEGVKNAMNFSTSLALILPRSVDSGFWYVFLSKIDFFSIWSLILLVLGGSIAMQKEKETKKLALYIFGIWLVYIILTALLGAKSGAAVA
jgi:hypothetical protein